MIGPTGARCWPVSSMDLEDDCEVGVDEVSGVVSFSEASLILDEQKGWGVLRGFRGILSGAFYGVLLESFRTLG